MRVLEKGHVYQPFERTPEGELLPNGPSTQTVVFVNKEEGREHPGTTTQEMIRILLDRTRHCNNCQPHYLNEHVIYHLRQALVKHEMRALERKAEKGDIEPEYLAVGGDGHFSLGSHRTPAELETPKLEPYRPDWDRPCSHKKEG